MEIRLKTNDMGSRYFLELDCVYCGKLNYNACYAPTSNIYTFYCEKCQKYSFIAIDFTSKKVEEVTYEDIRDAFFITTNVEWDEKAKKRIEKECQSELKRIKSLNTKEG